MLAARQLSQRSHMLANVHTSDAVLAEISLRSAQKIFIFIIKQKINRIKVSKNKLIKF